MICVSLVLIRNVDKCMAWILPLLSDKDANMKGQIFVLRKDTADILGNTIKDGNEQKVDRQSCQREAVNSLFVVSNSYSKQTNNCRLYLLIFLIRGLLRCSCRGGMQ